MRFTIAWLALAAAAVGYPAHAAPAFWTKADPFVGKWRLDVSRSTIVDEMRVEALGANRFVFNFEGGSTERVVADGSDQPGQSGTTLSVKADGPRAWTVVRKQAGQAVVSAKWTLSADGRTLRDSFTSVQADGSRMKVDYLYRRLSRGPGFAGVWESTTKPVGLKLELTIEPYDGKGLSFRSPGSDKKVEFDGGDHAVAGVKDDLSLSGRRRGARVVEYSEKSGGKVQRLRQFKLSTDDRTLTETLRTTGQAAPDLLVFERE